jgi:hypothetical protein
MTGKLSWFSFNKGREYLTITKLSQCKKYTRYPRQVERLRKLGVVLKRQQASKRALLSFKVINKKEKKHRMLFSDFREVTKGKLGNHYQLPEISTVLHEFTSLMQ